MAEQGKRISFAVEGGGNVSGLLQAPQWARACYVLAHGAGAGMQHPFLGKVAAGLAERGVATLRYQFPYMERGSKRPDTPKIAHAAVRAAAAEASRLHPGLPLLAGGKSFGGRMTSQTQAEMPLPGVRGLVFLGFPLHPAGRPSRDRAEHLFQVKVPMLFLQGTRDALAELDQLEPVCRALGGLATLKLLADADHSFHVPVKSGRTDAEALEELLNAFALWAEKTVAGAA